MTVATLAQTGRYTAGMPQLNTNGLSENWLLKECGDRHWRGIAQANGQTQPEFRDAQGHKVYAAFTLVRITAGRLEQIAENDAFTITSQCLPVGRAQHYSRHLLQAQGQTAARVEMLSAFVRRAQPGSNRGVVRAAMADTSAQAPDPALWTAAEAFVRRGKEHRATEPTLANAPAHILDFTPCPNNDFNGADLLYFSAFQAMVDRAEWAWMLHTQPPGRPAALREREMVFFGNLDLGDSVQIQLQPQVADEGLLCHSSVLQRQSDGVCIARVVTRKLAPVYANEMQAALRV
ncbi:MAG: Pnap_2097 family protein [Rhodoferax sp.]|uniref:Pnap_2097 family protein n=1 Tax=Rhodoferax sp. TaxID=50421 RepID=UPI003263C1B7